MHLGRPAARMNMTQPPLSRQIQLLEHVLGVRLLNRISRAVKLTPRDGCSCWKRAASCA